MLSVSLIVCGFRHLLVLVVKSLKNGIVLNLLGMGAAILGMQATVGLLVAKALTSSANPYYQQMTPGYSPVLALDVFLVQVLVQIQFQLSDIKVLLTTSS
jgi:hypothetical protein